MPLVAVTGTSGLVGAAVAADLRAAGWEVRGADRTPGPHTTLVGDLRDAAVCRAAVRSADAVVHAAALHAPHVGRAGDADFWSVNVGATAALLDAFGGRRFVYISSTSVYGHALVPNGRAVWVDETLEPRPRDIYDETKLAAERLAGAGTVLRIARCFPEPPPVLATHLLHRAVGLGDVAAAARAAVTAEATGTFTVAGRYPFTRADCGALFEDAASVIAERAPEVAAAFHARGWPLPRSLDRVYDSSAATAAIGYRPAWSALDFVRHVGDQRGGA
ncbi:NAD-dependent epimerase/dehydratase family protein [Actinoplanes sp. CA-054009]